MNNYVFLNILHSEGTELSLYNLLPDPDILVASGFRFEKCSDSDPDPVVFCNVGFGSGFVS